MITLKHNIFPSILSMFVLTISIGEKIKWKSYHSGWWTFQTWIDRPLSWRLLAWVCHVCFYNYRLLRFLRPPFGRPLLRNLSSDWCRLLLLMRHRPISWYRWEQKFSQSAWWKSYNERDIMWQFLFKWQDPFSLHIFSKTVSNIQSYKSNECRIKFFFLQAIKFLPPHERFKQGILTKIYTQSFNQDSNSITHFVKIRSKDDLTVDCGCIKSIVRKSKQIIFLDWMYFKVNPNGSAPRCDKYG